jgi:thioredoxin-like negative regulator of GroEL
MKKAIYFTAQWCSPCRSFRPILQEVMAETGANIQIIDVDQNPGLAQSFGISAVPTLILTDEAGSVLKRQTGVMPKSSLLKFLN